MPELEDKLRYLFEKYHQDKDSIRAGTDMGTMGRLNPNLDILLVALGQLEKYINENKHRI